MTNNLNNFILMISLSRLKNNFNYIEIQNNNIISVQLKPFYLQNKINIKEPTIETSNITKNNSDIFIIQNNEQFIQETSQMFETNFFNSFVNISESFKFDLEDWHFIYNTDENEEIKNKK